MTETRGHFHTELAKLEVDLIDMAELASTQIEDTIAALLAGDAEQAEAVVSKDVEIDRRYLELERRWQELIALQTPVAADLRLMTLILQTGHSVERVGDQAVNIAKITRAVEGLPRRETILLHIKEMGDIVVPMLHVALEALVKRDLSLAVRLPEMDEPVDRLNHNMYKEVADCGPDHDLLEWAVRMMLVSRALERVGDRAVDIGEQVAYLLTGEFQEFGHDASIVFDAR